VRLPSLGREGTRLLLVRHGEPEEASRGRVYGRLDYALSPVGEEQAAATCAWIAASHPPAALYVSPRRRARDTARPLAEALGLEARVRDGLAELDFGVCEGLPFEEVRARWPELARDFLRAPGLVRFPDGEAVAELAARAAAVVAELRAAHRGEAVAVVAHGGTNRAILADALGLPRDALFRLDQSYAAVSVLDLYDDGAVVRLLNALPP